MEQQPRETTARRSSLIDILAGLKVAVAQLRLYPKDSPQVLGVATSAYQTVTSYLNESGTLTMTRTPRGLLINGKRLPVSGEVADSLEMAMLGLLEEVRIKTISFRKGLTIDELITFLHALTRKFWDEKEGKEINRRLREERVLQVSVDEVDYVAVGKGDLVIEDAASKLAAGTRIGDIMRTLDQLIEASTEEGAGAEVRLHIMKKLLDQDPMLIKRAQAEGVKGTGEADAPGWITFEQARLALGDIARMMQSSNGPTRDTLRRLGHVVVGGFKHDPTICALILRFLSDEAADLIPVWMKGAEEAKTTTAAAVGRANSILSMEEDQQVHALAQEGGSLLKELTALERADLVDEILTLLSGFIRDRSASRRVAACDALTAMKATIETEVSEDARGLQEKRLRSSLNTEQDAHVYGKLAELAASFVDARIRKGEFEQAMLLLDTLKSQYQVKDSAFPQRVELAYRALERIASGAGFPLVLELLREDDPAAATIVKALDAAATRHLIAAVQSAENAGDRLKLAEMLSRTGPSAAAVLVEEAQKTMGPTEAVRLLEVIPHAVPDNMAEMSLGGLLKHPALAVRRRAAAVLAERNYGRSGTLVMDALREEKDPATRVAFVDALGRLKHLASVDRLVQIADARSEPDEVRSSACLALSRIANPSAVAVLAKLLGRGGIAGMLAPTSATLRTAAARALAGFGSVPEAHEALRRALDDPEPAVKAAARDVIHAPLIKAFGNIIKEVQMISAVKEVKTENWKLAGSLVEIPLDQICQLIGNSRKTGVLLLNFDGPVARVWFEEGIVAAAEFEGRQDQQAFNAFFHIKKGQFLFQPGEPPTARRLRVAVTQLLMEASVHSDEKARPSA